MSGPKVILITGCSEGGIGYFLCQAFAAAGCRVYATARKLEAMPGLDSVGCSLLTLDVTNSSDVKRVVSHVQQAAGKIDIVVNNAGMLLKGSAVDCPMDKARQLFDVNCFGAMEMIQAVIPDMLSRRSGIILNVGSVGGYLGTAPFLSAYTASKNALRVYTNSLRLEVEPFGVKVVYVAPG